MSAPRCCGACDFYRWAEQEGPGECRHRSPKAVEDRRSGAWRSQWPPVWPHEWCGAFQPKDQPTEEPMFLGTQAENIADMNRKGRRRGPMGAEHPKARVTESDIPAIRGATGSLREIGERYGLTISAIHAIRKRRTWRHVP